MNFKNYPLTILSIFFLVGLTFNSCKKDDNPLKNMPEAFTKKVLIEEFTAEWCSACANAFPKIQSVLDENPTTVFAATIHHNDPFSNDQTKIIKNAFSISSFPSSMVDRFAFGGTTPRVYPSTSTLRNRSEERMESATTSIGLKIETEILDGDLANITVYVGHNSIPDGIPRITTYLLEDDVDAINQAGSNDPNFKHHHVLREVLSNEKGSSINFTDEKRTFHEFIYENVDISDYNHDNLEIIAFVHNFDESDLANHEILNVQKVKLGDNKDWD